MKLVRCDGRALGVRDVAPVIFRLQAHGAPIKLHGLFILKDDEARELVRELQAAADPMPGERAIRAERPDRGSRHRIQHFRYFR
jgi:hypothetical protein